MSQDVQREFFDKLAARYDGRYLRARWPRNQELKARVVARAVGTAIERGPVVEVGCGTGQIAELLLRSHPELRYVGLDLSEPMLDVARSRLERFADRAELRVVAGDDLPLAEATYAAAFGVDVLHHVDDQTRLLRALRAALAPGATVVFLEGNPRFPLATLLALVQREERGLLQIGFGNLRRWFEDAGLEDVRVAYGPLYTPPGPARVEPALDAVDRAIARVPFLRALAIFLIAEGRAP